MLIPQHQIPVQIVSSRTRNLFVKPGLQNNERAEVSACLLIVRPGIFHGFLHFVGKTFPARIIVNILSAVCIVERFLDALHKITGFFILFKGNQRHQRRKAVPAKGRGPLPGQRRPDCRIAGPVGLQALLDGIKVPHENTSALYIHPVHITMGDAIEIPGILRRRAANRADACYAASFFCFRQKACFPVIVIHGTQNQPRFAVFFMKRREFIGHPGILDGIIHEFCPFVIVKGRGQETDVPLHIQFPFLSGAERRNIVALCFPAAKQRGGYGQEICVNTEFLDQSPLLTAGMEEAHLPAAPRLFIALCFRYFMLPQIRGF